MRERPESAGAGRPNAENAWMRSARVVLRNKVRPAQLSIALAAIQSTRLCRQPEEGGFHAIYRHHRRFDRHWLGERETAAGSWLSRLRQRTQGAGCRTAAKRIRRELHSLVIRRDR